jgi:hypothetical protein
VVGKTSDKMAKRKLPTDKEVIDLHLSGASSKEIGDFYDVCGSTVITFLKKRNIKIRTSKESAELRAKKMKGNNNTSWKGGRIVDKSGYILILQPEHPMANSKGYVREHVLVMEKALARFLFPEEVVHHINEDKGDNYIGNLIVFKSLKMHTEFHRRLRAFKICGHWDWYLCPYCHKYDSKENMAPKGKYFRHKDCISAYNRKRYEKKNSI